MSIIKNSLFLLGALWSLCASSAPYQVISVDERIIGQFKYTVTTVQNGADSRNQFQMHRLRKKSVPDQALKNPIILVPALGNNFSSYTVGLNADGSDFDNSLAATLAKQNTDVYGYSPRASLLAPSACETTVDCSIAADWGIAAYVDDVEFIRQQVATTHSTGPAVGGHSLGGIIATALVNQNPTGYRGLLMVDSMLVNGDPALQIPYQQLCAGILAGIGAGQIMDSQLNALAKTLLQLSLADPDGPTPVPFFPPGTTNRQAYIAFLTTPSVGPPAALFPPGFVTVVGSVPLDGFTYADEGILATAINRFDAYVPNKVVADIACSLGGDATFTGNLSAFAGAVLVIKAGAGFGDGVAAELALLTSAEISVVNHADYGHVDPIVSPDRKRLVDRPIARWLRQDVFSGTR
jgi:pimeloyl-ACP methyl ester carboxylesterase